MSEEEKKELEELKSLLYTNTLTQYGKRKLIYLYENLIETQDKMIDLMAEQLGGLSIFDIDKDEPLILGDKEEVKEYFRKKVEEDD